MLFFNFSFYYLQSGSKEKPKESFCAELAINWRFDERPLKASDILLPVFNANYAIIALGV